MQRDPTLTRTEIMAALQRAGAPAAVVNGVTHALVKPVPARNRVPLAALIRAVLDAADPPMQRGRIRTEY